MPRRVFAALLLVAAASGCSLGHFACGRERPVPEAAQAPQAAAQPADPNQPRKFTIAFLGDSLTAGLGLLSSQAYPALIEDMFDAEGYRQVEVLNAGLSGDTTAGGRRRVDALLTADVKILVVALGANDALRGLTVAQSRENLKAIIDAGLAKDLAVVLCGMEGPTNLGEDYRLAFRGIFLQLQREYGDRIISIPFLLEGVAGQPAMNQPDGIHPNEQGARVIATAMYPRLRDLVDQLGGG